MHQVKAEGAEYLFIHPMSGAYSELGAVRGPRNRPITQKFLLVQLAFWWETLTGL